MKLQQLSDLILSLPWKDIAETDVAVEMPDDKAQYAVSGVRYDEVSRSVIIEVA